MSDTEKLKELLTEIGIPFEVHTDKDYDDITINASASDKYITLSFKNGKYEFGN